MHNATHHWQKYDNGPAVAKQGGSAMMPKMHSIPHIALARRTFRPSSNGTVPFYSTSQLRRSHGGSLSHQHPPASPAASSCINTSPKPSARQLRRHFIWEAVPMAAFGFMDQSILIHSGNAIDCTLGVTFGLSTLTAAAFGSIISMMVGLATGGTVERAAMHLGLPAPGLTAAQRTMPLVHRVGFAGVLAGAFLGCSLGMVNLLLVDTGRSEILKLHALTKDQEIAFEVEASNRDRTDATAIRVKGPDVDGVLASMTAALAAAGYSVVELHAETRDVAGGTLSEGIYEDVFIVRPRGSKEKVLDENLDELAHTVLNACKDPLSSHSLRAQVLNLKEDNDALLERVLWLEKALEERQITVVKEKDTRTSTDKQTK